MLLDWQSLAIYIPLPWSVLDLYQNQSMIPLESATYQTQEHRREDTGYIGVNITRWSWGVQDESCRDFVGAKCSIWVTTASHGFSSERTFRANVNGAEFQLRDRPRTPLMPNVLFVNFIDPSRSRVGSLSVSRPSINAPPLNEYRRLTIMANCPSETWFRNARNSSTSSTYSIDIVQNSPGNEPLNTQIGSLCWRIWWRAGGGEVGGWSGGN